MTVLSHLNGSASTLQRAALERHPDESLHDFLLRRHEEMVDEIALLHAQVEFQTDALWAERWAAQRRTNWLIAGLALDATSALLLCLLSIFDNLPAPIAMVALTGLVGGSLITVCTPRIERALVALWTWGR